MSEGVTWFKHDVPDEEAIFRGKVIARHLKLKPAYTEEFYFSDIEDDGARFDTALGDKTHEGLYRSILTAIAEARREDYEGKRMGDQDTLDAVSDQLKAGPAG